MPPVSPPASALLTDWYQLTMAQAYWREGMSDEAVFSLYVRSLPEERNYFLACGLEQALQFLEAFRFDQEALDYLGASGTFSDAFLTWLRDLRFAGDVYAVPEGTPVFADEPLLEVVAPLPQAQLVETCVMNQVHFQTLIASKAARVVAAAAGRPVVDFGLRRMHGTDAGVKAARACYVAGVAATSNVLAGRLFDLPVAGTMAHSYIQAHDDEVQAFRQFVSLYPETVLLVDTYDTLRGVEKVIALASELGDACRIRAVRLDSGDLAALARRTRHLLDGAGFSGIEIFASGGLDEYRVADLLAQDAPIDGFGVGTRLGVSADVPALDIAYKLTSYGDAGRLKLSPGKPILPGRKQVYRLEESGVATGDVLARADEAQPGRPLLAKVMARGRRLPPGTTSIEDARAHAARSLAALPGRLLTLSPADPPFPVTISTSLQTDRQRIARAVVDREGSA